MRIRILSPEPAGPPTGNSVTASRWQRLLRALGHQAELTPTAGPCDVLVALHARKSAPVIAAFPWRAPIVLALTGTDLYLDTPSNPEVRRSLDRASRLVVLQPEALAALPEATRAKARVIYQSAAAAGRRRGPGRSFEVVVVANLRDVKDPFRTEEAVRNLPPASRIRVRHVGGALEAGLADEARTRAAANPRYAWLGERTAAETRRLIGESSVLVLSSRAEGGANVVSEAVVAGVPVLASRIPGSVGLLGEAYPGFFEAGDAAGLRALLLRAEAEPAFRRGLESWCRRLKPSFSPAREKKAWKQLLAELVSASSAPSAPS